MWLFQNSRHKKALVNWFPENGTCVADQWAAAGSGAKLCLDIDKWWRKPARDLKLWGWEKDSQATGNNSWEQVGWTGVWKIPKQYLIVSMEQQSSLLLLSPNFCEKNKMKVGLKSRKNPGILTHSPSAWNNWTKSFNFSPSPSWLQAQTLVKKKKKSSPWMTVGAAW